jgi:DNA-binding CsgD family transcriptional regulator
VGALYVVLELRRGEALPRAHARRGQVRRLLYAGREVSALAHASRADLYERAGLTEKQRQAAELYDAGYGQLAIARRLGISRANVRQRLDAIDQKIRSVREHS